MVAYRIGPRDAHAMTSANTAPRLWGLPGTFWSLWCAQLVNRVASFAQPFLALYLTQERGISVSAAGAVVSGVGVRSVVAALVGGWTADRYGRRVSMLAAQVLLSSALLGLALAQDLWQLAAAALLVGFGGDLIRPAMSATVADSVPAALQVRAYGLLFWAINLGFSVATVSAGALTRWGYPTLFIINAAASVIAGLIIWRGVPETRPASSGEKVAFLPVLLRDGPALVLVVVGTLYSVVYFQAYSALPLVMARQGISPAVYGLVLAVNGVVICLVQPLVVRWVERYRPERVYALGMVVLGAGFAATALARTPWQHAGAVTGWTLGEIAVAGVVGALLARRAPEALRGRYLSLAGLTFAAGAAFGPAVGTRVLDLFGATVLWAGCGGLALVGAVLLLFLPSTDEPRWQPQES